MPQHEDKVCPRCQTRFECKVGSINLCQCTTVVLSPTERMAIRAQYDDCLCAACLVALQKELRQQAFENRIRKAFAFFNLKPPFK